MLGHSGLGSVAGYAKVAAAHLREGYRPTELGGVAVGRPIRMSVGESQAYTAMAATRPTSAGSGLALRVVRWNVQYRVGDAARRTARFR